MWFAPNDIWNRVITNRTGILCPSCFVRRAGEMGIECCGWELRPDNYVSQETPNQSHTSPESQGETEKSGSSSQSLTSTSERAENSSETLEPARVSQPVAPPPPPNEIEHLRRMVRLLCDDGVNLEYCRDLAKRTFQSPAAAPAGTQPAQEEK
jgi:hypothetical protein